MEEAIVLYPSPPIGHLISMVELGKLLLTHRPSLSVHILITSVPYDSGSTAPYIANVAATIPSIKFHHLPTVTLPSTNTIHHEELTFDVLRLSNPLVREELLSISKNYTVHGLVVDFFCCAALSVAKELNIPGYHFSSSGAGIVAVFFYFPTIHNTTTKSLKDLKTLLHIPGVPPIPPSDMPTPVLDRDDKSYDYFLDSSRSFPESAGIIINTFESLESRAVKTASEGLCIPNDRTPPIYCIGPLITTEGPFGLERSGQRFLWVVRNPPSDKKNVALSAQPNIDLDSLLPEGFLDRTEERGLVLKSWAPQVAVLNHPSVGGFVTHCGWNSVLEAVCAGVPLLAWPLYAEQRLNRILLVEEMKLALPMTESENGFVSAAEVEERVRGLMESEEGKLIRERTVGMKIAAKVASSEGGSSRVALSKLVESWKDK
uniref:Glycosyltransferase n=1 Tax=Salix viminalis TaxID=40686 RepID=A0A6N2N694_SALVM